MHSATDAEEPRWSPSGKQIVFQEQVGTNFQIFVANADGSGQHQLTNVSSDNTDPSWSPDGKIAFLSERNGGAEVFVMNADGSDQKQLA